MAAALASNRFEDDVTNGQAHRRIARIGFEVGVGQRPAAPATVAELPDQALGDDCAQGRAQQEGLDTEIQQPRHGCGGRLRVQRGQNQMTGESRVDRHMGGFGVADLADHDDVGVLTYERPQGSGKCQTDRGLGLGL